MCEEPVHSLSLTSWSVSNSHIATGGVNMGIALRLFMLHQWLAKRLYFGSEGEQFSTSRGLLCAEALIFSSFSAITKVKYLYLDISNHTR